MPLPDPSLNSDKEDRGCVCIIVGSRAVPGAALLCAEAALRIGTGKVQAAVPQSLVTAVGVARPEIAVIPLHETTDGDPDPTQNNPLIDRLKKADAILIGPGLMNAEATWGLTRSILEKQEGRFVLDAGALSNLREAPQVVQRQKGQAILTPHAGEMARLLRWEKERVKAEPVAALVEAAKLFEAVVVLKGSTTYISDPKFRIYINEDGPVGLATGGSGDVLAGIIVALLGRGCTPIQAALWGVYLHAQAGMLLTSRIGKIGFLSSELLAVLPGIMSKL